MNLHVNISLTLSGLFYLLIRSTTFGLIFVVNVLEPYPF